MVTPPLHSCKPSPTRWLNRTYTLIYTIAIFALLYRHCLNLIYAPSLSAILLFVADLVLAFLWVTWQAFFLNPVSRRVFPENLAVVVKEDEYPPLDVFICTADPFKEPPIGVVNTALSVLAYEYPTDKLSVYVSDDGGSELTLYAFVEAAKFAKHWLPYCNKYNILERSPEMYFGHDSRLFPETNEIKALYDSMKAKIEEVVKRGSIDDPSIKAFSKWTPGFTRRHHPPIVEVILEGGRDKDISGLSTPNLIYVSREKNKGMPHHFKAGALNAMIRVSSVMTNAPIFLVLDCDMYSNDPKTPLRALCYFMDPNIDQKLAFVQFPQRFYNVNKNDTYAGEYILETRVCPFGMDGLVGTMFMGTNAFFKRQALLGTPSSHIKQATQQLITNKSILSQDILALAHRVTSSSYEENTKWGWQMGFRYGTLVEDVFTSFQMQCQGWKSTFCDPERPAFLGNTPISLSVILSQSQRWFLGFLQIGLSKYNPITFGFKYMHPLQALCFGHYYFRPFWSIPIIIYAFLPQLALLNSTTMFPKVSDPWFSLYVLLFLGAYGKYYLDFVSAGATFQKWWNHHRMWLILGCSSYPFSLLDWLLNSLGMSTSEFNVTSKVSDDELCKRYEEGVFEFGGESPLFLPIYVAVVVNLLAFVVAIIHVFMKGKLEELFVQIFITGFVVVSSWPIYEAMLLRNDKGKMPIRITFKSIGVALIIYLLSSFSFKFTHSTF